MRITVVRGAGLAGMVRESELDSANLDDAPRDELLALVDKAGVVTAPAAAPPPAHADELTYEIRIMQGAEPVVARFGEASLPDGARALMAWIAERPETQSRLAPPGR